MERDQDELPHPGVEDLDWSEEVALQVKGVKPKGQFSVLSDKARSMISTERQCALFCGGKKCKYCTSEGWPPEEMVVKGLYSQWVTENILAMARPSDTALNKYKQIQQFKDLGIKSIVNVQIAGEHADCGPNKLDPSGFLYNPQSFMEQEIFFYNFGWPDYGVASLSTILDMVKVMQFAVSEGKVAVHCHAGRGRTGVIIACYLVFTNRISGSEAIHYVREKRPGSIQTRQQMLVIQEFEKYLPPFRTVFASKIKTSPEMENDTREKEIHEFTLQQYLNRQRHILHGYESRRLKHIPKIIYVVCERLLVLAQRDSCPDTDLSRNSSVLESTFPTVSKLPSSNKKTSLAQKLRKNASKESLDRDTVKTDRGKKVNIFGNTRYRYQSISLEDLQNDDFKDVLEDHDTRSIGSSSEGDKQTLTKQVFTIGPDDEEDSDSTIGTSVSNRNGSSPGPSRKGKGKKKGKGSNKDRGKDYNENADKNSDSGKGTNSTFSTDTDKRSSNQSSGQSHEQLLHKISMNSLWSIDGPLPGELSEQLVAVVAQALAADSVHDETRKRADEHEHHLNEMDSAWNVVAKEEDPHVLSVMLWDWLDQLKQPILRVQDLSNILSSIDDPVTAMKKVEKGTRFTIEYLIKVISKLRPLEQPVLISIYEKLISHLTHQWVKYVDIEVTSSWAMSTLSSQSDEEKEHWTEMKDTTASKLFFFFNKLTNEIVKGSVLNTPRFN